MKTSEFLACFSLAVAIGGLVIWLVLAAWNSNMSEPVSIVKLQHIECFVKEVPELQGSVCKLASDGVIDQYDYLELMGEYSQLIREKQMNLLTESCGGTE